MKIWVDADACPRVIKDILFRAAQRRALELVLVANAPLAVPRFPYIRSVVVEKGFDVADRAIAGWVQTGDLVITADIPLAAAVVDKGVAALNPRGLLYSADNIRQQLSMRNFMDELRGAGVETGGPAAFHARDQQAFANQLEKLLQRVPKRAVS
ncbi:YaiI/YqxD family protein [Solimonas variicoloris]|uniref:YaiI/YqxD family protein n=1 Tax=Solimonas variicoloris TaxID=254408 RepID=UPI00037CBDCA|nr:YaiI/YqxD family protein [Solimonas variicoloris]